MTPPAQKKTPAIEPSSIDELVRIIALALRYLACRRGRWSTTSQSSAWNRHGSLSC
jgi:hypothetical protein